MDYLEILKNYLNNTNFIVYSASAGTGKTHTITKEELQHIFQNNGITDFIAITFTRAAAKEMKERIIEYLIEIAVSKNIQKLTKDALYRDLLNDIKSNIKPEETEKVILSILNNYSSLSIGTIDSLFARLLRAYQDKTKLPVDINITFDENDFYEELIIESLTNDPELSKMSESEQINFIKNTLNIIAINKGAINTNFTSNITSSITNISSFLLKSTNIPETFIFKDRDDITKEIERITDKLLGFGKSNFHSNFYTFLKNIKSKEEFKIKDSQIFTKKTDANIKSEIEELSKKLNMYIARLVILEKIEKYSKFLDLFQIFTRYYNEIKLFLREIPLNKATHELISATNNSSDEIVLRLGKDFSMILVDEFQDTSFEQFKVLKKLIDYLLSKRHRAIVVGDTKQAIYSFRGGDYKMLSELQEKKDVRTLKTNFRSRKVIVNFIGEIFPKKREIEHLCTYLDFGNDNKDGDSREYCKQAFLKTGAYDLHNIQSTKEGGYVEINTYGIDFDAISNGKSQEAFSQWDIESLLGSIKEKVDDVCNRGYKYRDICILTETNEDVIEIASYLIKENLPVKSYSSLDARERWISKEILSIMKYATDRNNTISLSQFLPGNLLQNKVKRLGLEREREELLKAFLQNTSRFNLSDFKEIYKNCFEEIFNRANSVSAYDLLILIYRTFDITSGLYLSEQSAYMSLLDSAIRIEKERDNTVKTFIEEFEKSSDEYNEYNSSDLWEMNISESIDAITVSTIHKMKGLGFPIVIYINKRKQREQSDKPLTIFKIKDKNYLLTLDKTLIKTMEFFKPDNIEQIKDEFLQKEIDKYADTINLHYVALTRAKDELYVFLFNSGDSKKGTKCILTSMIYNYFCRNKEKFNYRELIYTCSIGSKTNKKDADEDDFRKHQSIYISPFSIPDQKKVYLKSFLNRDEQARIGTIVHDLLSKIMFTRPEDLEGDVNRAISELEKNGVVVSNKENILERLKILFTNKEICELFEEQDKRLIRNEMEFVDADGNLMRADRVIIDQDQIFIIDYKTGVPTKDERREYKTQVLKYLDTIRGILKKPTKGYIIYLDLGEVEKI